MNPRDLNILACYRDLYIEPLTEGNEMPFSYLYSDGGRDRELRDMLAVLNCDPWMR